MYNSLRKGRSHDSGLQRIKIRLMTIDAIMMKACYWLLMWHWVEWNGTVRTNNGNKVLYGENVDGFQSICVVAGQTEMRESLRSMIGLCTV